MEEFGPLDFGIDFSRVKRIILVQKSADLRKGIDGYVSIVQALLHQNPTDGSLYLFTNRGRNKLKGILHDGNGYWLVYKRLARSHLKWPGSCRPDAFIEISWWQMKALMSGMTIRPDLQFLPKRPRFI